MMIACKMKEKNESLTFLDFFAGLVYGILKLKHFVRWISIVVTWPNFIRLVLGDC